MGSSPSTRAYAAACWALSALFAVRVLGQAIQRWMPQPFLPPAEAFQGSNLPYWLLLSFQLLILVVMVRVAGRIRTARLAPGRRAGRWLAWAGAVYLAFALGRIAIGLAVPDAHEWFKAWIPAFFHLVLAGFVLTVSRYHLSSTANAGMARIARALDSRIVLDESMARADQLAGLPGRADRWLVNLRVSKMGGLLRSLDFLRQARGRALRVIVGAHVGETSLLTRAALTVASAAGDALVAQEGACGTHLLERDVVDPPLMFGPGGILDAGAAFGTAPGWGLAIGEVGLNGRDSP
jgi:Enolase C-terminal domain-like